VKDIEAVYQEVVSIIGKTSVKPGCFMIASEGEVSSHLANVAIARQRIKGSSSNKSAMYTKAQWKNLKAYRKKYIKRYGKSKLPQAFFHLNDNPDKRCVMTSSTAILPTLRKAMGPIHCEALNRPVTPREALTAMGFVAYDSVAKATITR
jgi:hypothetical protein